MCAALIPPQETTTPRRATAWNPAWVSGFPLTHACKHGGARMHAPVCVLSLSWLPLSRPGALSSCCVCDGSRDLCANVLVCAQATSPACPITLPATSATPKHGAAPQTWRVARVKCYSSIVPIESGVSLQLQAVSIEFDVAACSPRLESDSRRHRRQRSGLRAPFASTTRRPAVPRGGRGTARATTRSLPNPRKPSPSASCSSRSARTRAQGLGFRVGGSGFRVQGCV